MNLEKLTTETRNEETMRLDELSTAEVARIMNQEDQKVAVAVEKELASITTVIDNIIKSFKAGGRLIYMGAGTSGRLGVLDAAECVPTFSADPSMVQGLIAGGMEAMTVAVEGAEDSKEFGESDLKAISLTADDIVIGIAASGRTPYVIGGLEYATKVGATTATLSCNKEAEISQYATYPIEVDAGPARSCDRGKCCPTALRAGGTGDCRRPINTRHAGHVRRAPPRCCPSCSRHGWRFLHAPWR